MPEFDSTQPTMTFTPAPTELPPEQSCIVCGRPSGGKAICSDIRCAQELAGL